MDLSNPFVRMRYERFSKWFFEPVEEVLREAARKQRDEKKAADAQRSKLKLVVTKAEGGGSGDAT